MTYLFEVSLDVKDVCLIILRGLLPIADASDGVCKCGAPTA